MVINKPELLTETEAASYIGMSVAYLRCGRSRGVTGNRTPTPVHVKAGRRVKYFRADLDAWLAERRVDPGARKRAAGPRGAAA